MKISIITALLSLPFAAANATVTMNFTGGSGATLRSASNFLDNAGGNNARVWGIVVDVAGNGFGGSGVGASTTYAGGINLTATNAGGATGQLLSLTGGGASDDVLFISQNLAVLGTGQDGATGVPFLSQIAGVNYASAGGALATGMSFALVWFQVPTVGSAAANGTFYGLFSAPTLTLPADPGLYNFQDNAAFVQGLDPARLANIQLGVPIPEPSVAILGGLGLLGLLRRRR